MLIPEIQEENSGVQKLKAVGVGCGWAYSYVVLENNDLYIWGVKGRGGMGMKQGQVRREAAIQTEVVPFLFPFKVKLSKPCHRINWEKIFMWIFLAIVDTGSGFFGLPKEVVFHVVSVIY
jgi:hypothetical protein